MANRQEQGGTPVVVDAQTVLNRVGTAVQNHGGGEATRSCSDQAITGDLQITTALGSGMISSNQTRPVNDPAPVVADKLTVDNMIGLLRLAAKCEKDGEDTKGIDQAFRRYMKANNNTLAEVQNRIGYMFSAGTGVQKNDTKAMEYYRKAAAQGHPAAVFNLAGGYLSGRGVQKDHAEALRLYLGLAEQGDEHAQIDLAMIYVVDQGVPRDETRALKWMGMAAAQGNLQALDIIMDWALGVDLNLTDKHDARLCRLATETIKMLGV